LALEDHYEELAHLERELADIEHALSLGLGDDVDAEFKAAKQRLLSSRAVALANIQKLGLRSHH